MKSGWRYLTAIVLFAAGSPSAVRAQPSSSFAPIEQAEPVRTTPSEGPPPAPAAPPPPASPESGPRDAPPERDLRSPYSADEEADTPPEGGRPPGYPQQGYRRPTPDETESRSPYGAPLDETGRYRQVLRHYVRPPNATMPGYEQDAGRAEYIVLPNESARRHDGMYLRLAGGVGTTNDTMQTDGIIPTERQLRFRPEPFSGDASGFSATTELAIGYTLVHGLVLGAGSYTATIPSPEAQVSDPRTGNYLFRVSQLALFSPMVDYYVFPDYGLHAQVGVGLATFVAGVGDPEVAGPRAQAHTATGVGFMGGIGYEFWITDTWSLGLLARVLYGSMTGTDSKGVDWSHKALAPSGLVTATYH